MGDCRWYRISWTLDKKLQVVGEENVREFAVVETSWQRVNEDREEIGSRGWALRDTQGHRQKFRYFLITNYCLTSTGYIWVHLSNSISWKSHIPTLSQKCLMINRIERSSDIEQRCKCDQIVLDAITNHISEIQKYCLGVVFRSKSKLKRRKKRMCFKMLRDLGGYDVIKYFC